VSWIGLLGAPVVAAAIISMVATFIVPRDTPSRVAGWVGRAVNVAFRSMSRRFDSYQARDRILAFQGPWFLVMLLTTWLAMLLGGYAGLLVAFADLDVGTAFREAGSSIVTLGFAATPSPGATVIDLAAGGSGLFVVALLIGYLPVLYGAFNRRERTVTMLESRAGAPAWGPEILWRHQRIEILDSLPQFYEHWEEWCADVAETHSSYFVLLFFRSPDPLRHWLTGLLAVLDSAALYNALCPTAAPSETRLCLRMGFTCLRTLADVMYIKVDPDPHPDTPIRLTYEEYMEGVKHLADIGFPMERTPEEAWPHFRGWRVNYEPAALALADIVVPSPGKWTGRPVGEVVIPTKRPVDRTPDEPEGTEFTRPGTYETG
jgi:hypothetical protein